MVMGSIFRNVLSEIHFQELMRSRLVVLATVTPSRDRADRDDQQQPLHDRRARVFLIAFLT
jgi:hypothetical protein